MTTVFNSIWYKVLPTASGQLHVNLVSNAWEKDTQVAVYNASSCDFSTFTLLGSNDDSSTAPDHGSLDAGLNVLSVGAGNQIYIQIDGWKGAELSGDMFLELELVVPNDNVCSAIPISLEIGGSSIIDFTLIGAWSKTSDR